MIEFPVFLYFDPFLIPIEAKRRFQFHEDNISLGILHWFIPLKVKKFTRKRVGKEDENLHEEVNLVDGKLNSSNHAIRKEVTK